MAKKRPPGTRKTVKDILADAHVVAPVDLNKAEEEANRSNRPLQQVIVDMGLVDKMAMLQALAAEWNVKPVVFEEIQVQKDVAKLIVRRHRPQKVLHPVHQRRRVCFGGHGGPAGSSAAWKKFE